MHDTKDRKITEGAGLLCFRVFYAPASRGDPAYVRNVTDATSFSPPSPNFEVRDDVGWQRRERYLVATLSFNFVNPIVPQRAAVSPELKAPRWEYTLVVVGVSHANPSKACIV